jgi:hypothetical protein
MGGDGGRSAGAGVAAGAAGDQGEMKRPRRFAGALPVSDLLLLYWVFHKPNRSDPRAGVVGVSAVFTDR